MANAFAPSGTPTFDGTFHVVPGTLTIDSYPAGGYTPVASNAKITAVRRVRTNARSSLGYLLEFDGTKVRAYRGNSAGGLQSESWPDVKGGVFANVTADAVAAALNDAAVMALADANAVTAGSLAHAAGKSTGLTNPNTLDAEVVGRNVVVAQKADVGGTTFTAANVVVTGTAPDGTAQTETIAIQTGAVIASNWRLTVGTKAFATVTNVRLTAAQPAGSTISVGVGTIFGLRGSITAESDVKSVRKDAAAVAAATYVATASPSQIDLGADVADNVDLLVTYDASASELVNVEAATSANIGTVQAEYIGD